MTDTLLQAVRTICLSRDRQLRDLVARHGRANPLRARAAWLAQAEDLPVLARPEVRRGTAVVTTDQIRFGAVFPVVLDVRAREEDLEELADALETGRDTGQAETALNLAVLMRFEDYPDQPIPMLCRGQDPHPVTLTA